MASGFADDCRVPQGFVFALGRSTNPFGVSVLSRIINPSSGLKYLQIYHSVTGGQTLSAQDQKNNLRFLELQTRYIIATLPDVKAYVPELQSDVERWESVANEMLTTVLDARALLSSGSDWLQLKVLVRSLDDHLDIMTKEIDLLVARLEPYKNRTSIGSVIDLFVGVKADIPKTISLSFSKNSIQQNFAGLRFLLTAQICHNRLCFPNMQTSVWSLRDNQCGTSPSRQEAGLSVEGNALQFVSLGRLLTLPEGGNLKMTLTLTRDLVMTTFESLVNLLGMTKNVTITMNGTELSFKVWGHMFGAFDAVLNVKGQLENVVDWNSMVFKVEGTMNRSSRFHTLLENKIINASNLWAKEATRRLTNAQAALNNAKRRTDLAREVLKSKQAATEKLNNKKEIALVKRNEAGLKYNLAKSRFNSIFDSAQNVSSKLMCEIQVCNYTCLNGCITPDLCQNPKEIKYLEQQCDTVERHMLVEKVETRIEKRSFAVPTFITRYTGNCRSGDTVIASTVTGGKLGGPVGALIGFFVGVLSKSIFGCSDTFVKVPGEPKIVEYYEKIFEKKAVEVTVNTFECTGPTEKTKPGGFELPHKCCREHGCQIKVLDRKCVLENNKCRESMTELRFILDAKNESLHSEFLSLRHSVDELKEATFSYEKAAFRHESAVSLLKQVEAHMKQQLSVVEIANASMLHVRRNVEFGLKISEAMNASNSRKVIDVEEMEFSLTTASGDTRRIVVETSASSVTGRRVPVSFLVDFDQVERSSNSASKAIIAKLFGDKYSRRKRSAPQDSANVTYTLHSSFLDYPLACLFVNNTHLYLSSVFHSLGDVIASVEGLMVNLSYGFYELERLYQAVNYSNSISNHSFVNDSSAHQNSSFLTEYLELIQVLKDENMRLTNDFSQYWNDTLEDWRAFLEIFTSNQQFSGCSGLEDCIGYFFDGAKEFYEFEDSPLALEIKSALPHLKDVTKSLTSEALSMLQAKQALNYAAFLLNKTRDDSVLCGGTPLITSSSQGEVILFPGDGLSLNCSAEKEEGLKYAWRKNDQLIEQSMDGSLYLHSVTKDNEGAYVCVASNNKGSTFSNVTIVKVHSKPKITQPPQSQRVVFRSQLPATFLCNATAEPSPTFQWYFQSTDSSSVKINERRPVLYMANPQLHQEGYYYCEASNEHGAAVSQRARLDVLNYTIGLPRLLIAFNLTSHCFLTSNSSKSSAQDPCTSESDSFNVLPSSLDKNLTNNLLHSLTSSLNLSIEVISNLVYHPINSSKSSLVFVIDVDNEPLKEENFTSYMEIVETITVVEANLRKKLKQFNSDVFNKTFEVPWKNNSLLGEPGSITVYPLPPKCPMRQSLRGNGFICGKFPVSVTLLVCVTFKLRKP